MRPVKAAVVNSIVIRKELDNVFYVYRPAVLIFEDGQVWEVLVSIFRAHEDVVFMMWNETPHLFTRREVVPIK